MNVATILSEKGRKVITTHRGNTLLDVAKLLNDNKIGSILILDEDEAVIGIVSERDIVRRIAAAGASVLNSPIETCMTTNVISCQESDTIDQIMSEMTKRRFRHMPVVEDKKLVGIISIGDVVKLRIAEAEMEADAMRQYIATG